MANLYAKKEQFVKGLVENAGWDAERANEHYKKYLPMFEIGNELDFVLSEAERLRSRYPKILVAPLLYRLEDNKLYHIHEKV